MRIACCLLALLGLSASTFAQQPITLELRDYATMPITGAPIGKATNEMLLARVNTIREEPGGANRLFVTDMNGPLYILDKKTKQFTKYLDFDGANNHPGMFKRFFMTTGYGNGLNGFHFDPDYRRNGKFYTVHMEDPKLTDVSNLPDTKSHPGLKLDNYTTTDPIQTPGETVNEGVLIEWTDTNPSNNTFEGSARELMRVRLNTRSHPMGEVTFNPAARPGDPDWRVLYCEVGDGASGESRNVAIRPNPQRLDNLVGKIIRIIPDLNEQPKTSFVSPNGRYRIPNDNPFVKLQGARPEIWAYGLRNPHRLSWAIDPSNPANNRLIANSVGFRTYETVNIIERGSNHGWPYREGIHVLNAEQKHAPIPAVDKIPIQIGDEVTDQVVTPKYPVIEYPHEEGGGDAIGSGFVYNGKLVPALRGKYIFGDITTGRFWYADYKEMLAADGDNNPMTQAKVYPVMFAWDNPGDAPDAGKKTYETMWPINEMTYHSRGGKEEHLASRQRVANQGRADARLAIDGSGELYMYSKSDGMIRQIVGVAK